MLWSWQLDENRNICFLDGEPAICFSLEIQRGYGARRFRVKGMGREMETRPYGAFAFAMAERSSKWPREKKNAATSSLHFGPKHVWVVGKFSWEICIVRLWLSNPKRALLKLTCYIIKLILVVFRDTKRYSNKSANCMISQCSLFFANKSTYRAS